MASTRTPGPVCGLERPTHIQDGTLCLAPSPRPGAVGIGDDIASWPVERKLIEAAERAIPFLPADLRDEFAGLFTGESLAMLGGVLGLWAAGHLFGVSEVIDVALLAIGLIVLGAQARRVFNAIKAFLDKATNARSDSDLDQAGIHLAEAVAIIGVTVFMALVTKSARRFRGGKGKGPSAGKAAAEEVAPPKGGGAAAGGQKPPSTSTPPATPAPPKPKVAAAKPGKPMPGTSTDPVVTARMKTLEAEGHGPQRHEGAVTEQQLEARAIKGVDPMSGTTTDAVTGMPHKYGKNATKINTPEDYVQAEQTLRNSPEFAAEAAQGKATIVVKDAKLESIYGPDYRTRVSGKTALGTKKNPTGVTDTDFTDGSMKGVWDKDVTTGDYKLTTMYPEPKP